MEQTIFALASAPGRAGIAVIRLSGPLAFAAAGQLTSRTLRPRHATYATLSWDGDVIDQAVVIWFRAPHSFTGEDVVELHVHGSRAVLDRLYGILIEQGLRLAGPGEFSRRAVASGKLDLTQAEAIADLVDAESEAQRRQALTQLDGGLKAQYEAWRADMVELLARIEVYIDFPDEDLPRDLSDGILSRIKSLEDALTAAIADSERGRQIREGFRVVILGAPNAGKSSLFNALLKTEAAIVTPVAGTTRDVIEAHMRVGSYTILLYDTAGLRETEEVVEAEGIRRALARADEADLRLWVIDSSDSGRLPGEIRPGDLLALSKIDLYADNQGESCHVSRETPTFRVSTATGEGLDDLVVAIERHVEQRLSGQIFPAATRQRHVERLTVARDQLRLAYDRGMTVPELTAEHVRSTINAFEQLFGRYDVEGVLDIVFSTFCIGK